MKGNLQSRGARISQVLSLEGCSSCVFAIDRVGGESVCDSLEVMVRVG
jgi:hypothetical protein